MEENNNNEQVEQTQSNESFVGIVEDKKKTSNVVVVILVLIIVGLLGYIGYDKLYASNKVNTNINNSGNVNNEPTNNSGNVNNEPTNNSGSETKKELDSATKKELLSLIGLTENGLEKMTEEDVKGDELPSGNYAYCFGNNLSATFFRIKKGTYEINNLDMDTKKNIVRWGAHALGLMDNIMIPEDEEVTCTAGSSCDGITESNFNKVIKRYNITGNVKDYFNEYDWQKRGDHYVYLMSGYISVPCSITDNLTFEEHDNSVDVIYDIKQDEVNDSNGYHLNKKITYSFRANADGNYSLYQVKVEEK